MICRHCGTQNRDGDAFCRNCGTSLEATTFATPPAPAPAQQQYATVQQSAPVQQQYAPVPAAAPYAQPMKQEGCVAAAWRDVKGTPGWFKKMLLLGLCNAVPILNWIVPGFALRWARGLSFGKREDMPQEIFGDRAFVTGFFYALITAIVFAVLWTVSYVMGFVAGYRLAGVVSLALLVLSVFWGMFGNACIIRMAVCDNLGAAFGLSKVWQGYKKALGSLFCASIVPGLIVGLIGFGIALLLILLLSLVAVGGIASMTSYGYYGSNSAMVGNMLAGIGVPGVILLLIGWLLFSMLQALSITMSMRALGHWASRVAPEWASEATIYAPYGMQNVPYGQYVAPTSAPAPISAQAPVVVPSPTPAPTPTPAPVPHAVSPRDESTTMLRNEGTLSAPALVLERERGDHLVISSFPATVGKGSAANICIEGNSSISRVHVRISQAGASLVVEDLGSTNGTYINGDCLAEGELVILHDGDELRLGKESFTIRLG